VISACIPPFSKNGVVGDRWLFVVAHQFSELELGVAREIFVGVEFDEFVKCECSCDVCIRTCGIDAIIRLFFNCVEEPVNFLFLIRRASCRGHCVPFVHIIFLRDRCVCICLCHVCVVDFQLCDGERVVFVWKTRDNLLLVDGQRPDHRILLPSARR
jgi:hypothetical protein